MTDHSGHARSAVISAPSLLILLGTLAISLAAPSSALASSSASHNRTILTTTNPSKSGGWGDAEQVPGIATLEADGGESFAKSVSCSSAGNCAAGGWYAGDEAGHAGAFVVSETDGTWGDAEQVPGIAYFAEVNSVSCFSVGNCSAGGFYDESPTSSESQAFVVTETNGTWGDAEEVPGSATLNVGNDAEITSVSCASTGNCSAGGFYQDMPGSGPYVDQAFVVDETNGTWGDAEEVPGMATLNVGNDAQLDSVSCGSAGNCAAGGLYSPGSDNFQAFVVNEKNGTWGDAEMVPGTAALNKRDEANTESVSCTSARGCTAGGNYPFNSFVVSEKKGEWRNATKVPGIGHTFLASLSCASAGDCSAGGYFSYKSPDAGDAMVVNETNGTWADAEVVPGTATLNAKGYSAGVSSVSCASAGDCGAGGSYDECEGDEPCGQAFVVSEKSGKWLDAEEVPGTATLNAGDDAGIISVSCASGSSCAAGGYYADSSDNSQAFVVNSG